MAQAVSISLKKLTESVNNAVKAATAKHPKFKFEAVEGISVSYLIRGIPVPDGLLRTATLPELQSFATDVAQHVSAAHQGLVRGGGPAAEGAVIAVGGRIIVGTPPIENFLLTE
jgi:hypothetical protein